jgi:hypothetical protein
MTEVMVNRKARRQWEAANESLADAEELHQALKAMELTHNGYWNDAVRKAAALVDEMENELDYVMGQYTPEECGL